jgi:FkbM family methyltransferase
MGHMLGRFRRRIRSGRSSTTALERIKVTAIFGTVVALKDDLITRQIIDFGAHTRPELAFLLSIIDPRDRVFDIGAHIGTFAIPIAHKVGSEGQVLAIEGSPSIFDLLVENIRNNSLTNVITAQQSLIAPVDSAFKPTFVPKNSAATYFVPGEGPRSIPQYTIDELARKTFHPDVIKIDIEGLEAWALGGSSIVAQRKPILYVEVSNAQLARYGATSGGLEKILRSFGYRLFRNDGPRNASNDNFWVRELHRFVDEGGLFDVLAVPHGNPRLRRLI